MNLHFAFGSDPGNHLPLQLLTNCVVYTDYDTTIGWFNQLSDQKRMPFGVIWAVPVLKASIGI